jgi:putative acyl-CoA dehydrogenase
MPRLYREAPLSSIWEGPGNVIALDTLRAMQREPQAVEALFSELEQAAGSDSRYDDQLSILRKEFSDTEHLPHRARWLVERAALLLQGSLLLRHGDPAVTEAFIATRVAGRLGHAYGTLPTGLDLDSILARAAIG